nr:MAG TPA: hypothetical protein [Caudoviricetes sp.]
MVCENAEETERSEGNTSAYLATEKSLPQLEHYFVYLTYP